MKLTKGYFKYVLEVMAIVIGVSISFYVEEWREDRGEHDEYLVYLDKMRQDLKQDSLYLQVFGSRYSSDFKSAKNIYNILYRDTTISDYKHFVQELIFVFRSAEVKLQSNTFDELQAAGKLRLVEDDSLRFSMISYYPPIEIWNNTLPNRNYKALDIIIRHAPVDLLLNDDFDPFNGSTITKEFNFKAIAEDVIPKLISDDEFHYLFKNSLRTLQAISEVIEDSKLWNQKLLKQLDAILKREG